MADDSVNTDFAPTKKLLQTRWSAELSEHEKYLLRSGSPYPFVLECDMVPASPNSEQKIIVETNEENNE